MKFFPGQQKTYLTTCWMIYFTSPFFSNPRSDMVMKTDITEKDR